MANVQYKGSRNIQVIASWRCDVIGRGRERMRSMGRSALAAAGTSLVLLSTWPSLCLSVPYCAGLLALRLRGGFGGATENHVFRAVIGWERQRAASRKSAEAGSACRCQVKGTN